MLRNDDKENQFYNGWTWDHYIGAFLVLCPDGTNPVSWYNIPGTVHDSLVAYVRKIYNKLEELINTTGGRCTVDSAFSCKNYPFLIKFSKPSVDVTIDKIEMAE